MKNNPTKGVSHGVLVIDNALTRITNKIAILPATCLILVMLMAVIDAVGSKLFDRPLAMAYETTQMLSIPIAFIAIGAVAFGRGAMRVDLLLSNLSANVQTVIVFFGNLMGMGISAIIAWRAWIYMFKLIDLGTTTTGAINLLQWPFCFILCFGWVTFGLGCLFRMLRPIFKYEPLPDLRPDQILAAAEEKAKKEVRGRRQNGA